MSSFERAAMMGKLAEARQTRDRLRFRIRGLADAIRPKLNLTLTTPDELDVPVIDEQWDQVKSAWAELAVINGQIDALERELK